MINEIIYKKRNQLRTEYDYWNYVYENLYISYLKPNCDGYEFSFMFNLLKITAHQKLVLVNQLENEKQKIIIIKSIIVIMSASVIGLVLSYLLMLIFEV
jgi:hypothetical protein